MEKPIDRKTVNCIVEAMERAGTAQIKPIGQETRFRDCFTEEKGREFFWYEKPMNGNYSSGLIDVNEVQL